LGTSKNSQNFSTPLFMFLNFSIFAANNI